MLRSGLSPHLLPLERTRNHTQPVVPKPQFWMKLWRPSRAIASRVSTSFDIEISNR